MHELLFADDSALVAANIEDIQQVVDHVFVADMFGFRFNISKTEWLYQPLPQHYNSEPDPVNVYMKGTAFTYLRSTVT